MITGGSPKNLLAKSIPHTEEVPYGATLVGHLQQTLDVVEVIIDAVGTDIIDVISVDITLDELKKVLQIAAVAHDLGKAADNFQRQVHHQDKRQQALIRHEIISDWLLFGESGHKGLKKAVKLAIKEDSHTESWKEIAIRSAIVGHHLKFSGDRLEGVLFDDEIQIYWNHADLAPVKIILQEVLGQTIDWNDHPVFNPQTEWVYSEVQEPFEIIAEAVKGLKESERQLCSVIRGMIIAADTLASIVSMTREIWIAKYLPALRETSHKKTLSQQLEILIKSSEKNIVKHNDDIDNFQERVACTSTRITLVEGSCGTGKTLAAYRWAKKQEKPFLFMMYPTTATATQGYIDYALTLGDEAQLIHSRSLVDNELYEISKDVEEPEDRLGEGEKESIYQALERLNHPLTICTVDTVLGVMQNFRSSLLLLPTLMQSVLVFDEIHSYDDKLFEHLIRFLKIFRMPVLIMTASLQPQRIRVLEEMSNANLKIGERENPNFKVKGPPNLEQLNRYRIRVESDFPIDKVEEALDQGQKILIIVNSVGRARNVYDVIKNKRGSAESLYLYHSQFKYLDRLKRQAEIVKAFKSGKNEPLCVVTTQIAEMSFDVSADCLFSEIAPYEIMIQRLGRLNRYAWDGKQLGQAYVWPAEKDKPYEKDELDLSSEILQKISKEEGVSQERLAYYQREYSNPSWKGNNPRFLWEVFSTGVKGQALRKIQNIKLDYILRSDYDQAKNHGIAERLKYIIPMPIQRDEIERDIKRWRHVRIVDDERMDYTVETGGRWLK